MFDVYLNALNIQDDPVLQTLCLQGLGHFIGIRLRTEHLDKISQTLLCLLERQVIAENVVEEICQFFHKSALTNETWIVDQVVPQLFQKIHSSKMGNFCFVGLITYHLCIVVEFI